MKGLMFTVRWNMILSISESSDVQVTCVLVCHFLRSYEYAFLHEREFVQFC